MKKIILLSFALVLAFGFLGTAKASVIDNPKVNICHKTDSEKNPWVAIQVSKNDGLKGSDYLYAGPLDEKGAPDKKLGDDWCNTNVPILICRQNKDGVWGVVSVAPNTLTGTDFIYKGSVDKNGKPTDEAWCKANVPPPPVAPPVVPPPAVPAAQPLAATGSSPWLALLIAIPITLLVAMRRSKG